MQIRHADRRTYRASPEVIYHQTHMCWRTPLGEPHWRSPMTNRHMNDTEERAEHPRRFTSTVCKQNKSDFLIRNPETLSRVVRLRGKNQAGWTGLVMEPPNPTDAKRKLREQMVGTK